MHDPIDEDPADENTADEDPTDEQPLERDRRAYDEPAVITCPYCGKSTSEYADVCHACGSFILPDDGRRLSRGWRWVAIALLLMMLLGLVTWRL